jgi:hypothetical protein
MGMYRFSSFGFVQRILNRRCQNDDGVALRSTENAPLSAGHQHHLCQWTASLQSNFATCVLTFVKHVPESAKGIMLTTTRDARGHAAAALTNAEG